MEVFKVSGSLMPFIGMCGIGFVTIVIGFFIVLYQKRKRQKCTYMKEGIVVKYSFINNTPAPIVEYDVDGTLYRKKRYFSGVIETTSPSPVKDQNVYIDKKDVVHIHRGIILDLGAAARKLYPMGSKLTVFYNPKNPKEAYVEKIPTGYSVNGIVVICAGLLVILTGVISTSLIP